MELKVQNYTIVARIVNERLLPVPIPQLQHLSTYNQFYFILPFHLLVPEIPFST